MRTASDDDRWRRLLRTAETLEERFRAMEPAAVDRPQTETDALDHDRAHQRRQRWAELAARLDEDAFARRLSWLGASKERLLEPLEDAGSLEAMGEGGEAGLPCWLVFLQEVSTVAASGCDSARRPPTGDSALPFEELLLPLAVTARRRLDGSLSSEVRKVVDDGVLDQLERHLLENLAEVAADALMEELNASRPQGQRWLNAFLGHAVETASASRRHYLALVEGHLRHGLLDLWLRFPALARAAATRSASWIQATKEFLQDLASDLPRLERELGCGSPGNGTLGNARRVEPGWSDPHRGFRSVIGVTFASGMRVVYKPRSLAPEVAYARLVDWLARRGAPIRLTVPRIVTHASPRDARVDAGHGWMELVATEPCRDRAAAGRFYQRSGAQLCLLYVLGGCDFHHDNVIACGESPIAVDLETLLQPEGDLTGSTTSHRLGDLEQRFWSSVLRTGFLPRWELGTDGRTAFDLSALGGMAPQTTGWRKREWQAVNTDAMHCAHSPSVVQAGSSTPTIPGNVARPEQHLEDLIHGFEATYRLLLRERDALCAPGGPLDGFRGCRTRVLLRATSLYYGILDRAFSPAALRSGADQGIEIDALARALLLGDPVLGAPEILAAERASLLRGDIPYFWVPSDGHDLMLENGESIERCYRRDGIEAARERIAGLHAQDLVEQVALIRGTIHASVARPADGARSQASARGRVRPDTGFEGRAIDCVRRIADELERDALAVPEGGVRWIGLGYLAGAARYQLMPLGANLYDGGAGIGVFLAALSAVDRDSRWAALARASLEPVRRALRGAAETGSKDPRGYRDGSASSIGHSTPSRAQRSIGGLAGLGSLVYGLSRAGTLLQDPSLLEDACIAAAAITDDAIEADRQLDVVSGAAGALLGLLVLEEEIAAADLPQPSREEVFGRALVCAQHLLDHRQAPSGANGRTRAWRSAGEDVPLTGFSHGAAGIAYSLARLYRREPREEFRQAALDGIRYETQCFCRPAGNWPDLRRCAAGVADRRFGWSWCHGAPGIGLARVGCTHLVRGCEGGGGARAEGRRLIDDIEVAVQAVRSTHPLDVDTVCCGNFGRVETLLVAATGASRPELLEEARALAGSMLEHAERHGGFQLFWNLPREVRSPGFFQGTAGIGYQLLRLLQPERLPSVLLLE